MQHFYATSLGCFLIFTFLLVTCFKIQVFSPTNYSKIGSLVHLSLEVYFVDGSFYYANNSSVAKLQLLVILNGIELFAGTAGIGVFECIISESNFVPGENTLTISVFQGVATDKGISRCKKAYGQAVLTLIQDSYTSSENVDALLSHIVSHSNSPHDSSFLFAGFPNGTNSRSDNGNIAFELISKIGAKRVEWLVFGLEVNGVPNSCTDFVGTFKYVHCISDVSGIRNIAFVDYSFININALENEIARFSRNVSRNYNVSTIVSLICILTRKAVMLFTPLVMTSETFQGGIDFVSHTAFEVMRFHRDDNRESSIEVLPGWSVWVSYTKLEVSHDIRSTNSISKNRKNGSPIGSNISRIVMDSYQACRSFILLEKVCLSEDRTLLVVFNDDTASPIVNEAFLAADEDRGFLYTGMRFLEVPTHGADASYIAAQWPTVIGTSALSAGVQPGHLVHETEPLLQLLFAAFSASRTPRSNKVVGEMLQADADVYFDGGSGNISGDMGIGSVNNTMSLREKYSYLFARLERVFLGTVTTDKASDWLMSFVGSIAGYWRQKQKEQQQTWRRQQVQLRHHNQHVGSGATEGSAAAVNADKTHNVLEIFLHSHLFPPTRVAPLRVDSRNDLRDTTGARGASDGFPHGEEKAPGRADERAETASLPRGVCFDQLLLLGRANAHVGYFGSEVMAEEFKRYNYDRFQIPYDESVNSNYFPKTGRSSSTTSSSSSSSSSSRDQVREGLDPAVGSDTDGDCILTARSLGRPEQAYPRSHQWADIERAPLWDPDTTPRTRKLRVTVVVRGGSERVVLNFDQVLETIRGSGVVNLSWLRANTRPFELLTFAEQVLLMAKTDVLIAVHGAALINGIFMRRGSAAINILNAPFIEFVFSPPLREAGVQLMYVPVANLSQCECPVTFPSHCTEGPPHAAAALECVQIRRCSVRVDLGALHTALMQAYYHVLSAKWIGQPNNS